MIGFLTKQVMMERTMLGRRMEYRCRLERLSCGLDGVEAILKLTSRISWGVRHHPTLDETLPKMEGLSLLPQRMNWRRYA